MICGIDEAGRGPLAGPVCAAAVILSEDFPKYFLDDSKKLSPSLREELAALIYSKALAWGIGWASAGEIDEINILKASLLAMKRAFEQMLISKAIAKSGLPESIEVIVDGLYVPDISMPSAARGSCRALVKADAKIPEVMAASILAKTTRDQEMDRYSDLYPEYGYDTHKGYPTAAHRAAIARYGPSPIQRMTFKIKV